MRWSKKKIALYLLFGVPIGMYLGMQIGVTRMASVFLEETYVGKNKIEKIFWHQASKSLEICVEGDIASSRMDSYLVKIPLDNNAFYLLKDKRTSYTSLEQHWYHAESCKSRVPKKGIQETQDPSMKVKVKDLRLTFTETYEVIEVIFLINGSEIKHEFITITAFHSPPPAAISWGVLILGLIIDVIIWPVLVVFMFLLASFT